MSSELSQNLQMQGEPSLSDLLKIHEKQINLNLNCHAIGTIQTVDYDSQKVSASINYKKTFFKTVVDHNGAKKISAVLQDYPLLVDMPMITLYGGNGRITMPVSQGDVCLILFNDRDIDSYITTGADDQPNTSARLHSFTDGIALVGLRPFTNAHKDYPRDRVEVSYNDSKVGVGEKINIENSSANLQVQLSDLCDKLNSLINEIATLTVICAAPLSPSTVPVNAAAISAIATDISSIKTNIEGLLE